MLPTRHLSRALPVSLTTDSAAGQRAVEELTVYLRAMRAAQRRWRREIVAHESHVRRLMLVEEQCRDKLKQQVLKGTREHLKFLINTDLMAASQHVSPPSVDVFLAYDIPAEQITGFSVYVMGCMAADASRLNVPLPVLLADLASAWAVLPPTKQDAFRELAQIFRTHVPPRRPAPPPLHAIKEKRRRRTSRKAALSAESAKGKTHAAEKVKMRTSRRKTAAAIPERVRKAATAAAKKIAATTTSIAADATAAAASVEASTSLKKRNTEKKALSSSVVASAAQRVRARAATQKAHALKRGVNTQHKGRSASRRRGGATNHHHRHHHAKSSSNSTLTRLASHHKELSGGAAQEERTAHPRHATHASTKAQPSSTSHREHTQPPSAQQHEQPHPSSLLSSSSFKSNRLKKVKKGKQPVVRMETDAMEAFARQLPAAEYDAFCNFAHESLHEMELALGASIIPVATQASKGGKKSAAAQGQSRVKAGVAASSQVLPRGVRLFMKEWLPIAAEEWLRKTRRQKSLYMRSS